MEKKFLKKIQTSGPRLNNLFCLSVILILISFSVPIMVHVHGHGVGSETFPPIELDGKMVTLEVSSSQNDPEKNDDQQISISLIDFDSKITLRDVTFLIKSERGENFLFEKEFKADNGFVVFNFVSENIDSVQLEEEQESNLFGSLLGLDSRMIHVKGPKLSEGGLYKFDVSILAANGYSNILDNPLVFNAGISIPQTTKHVVNDPNFGEQYVEVITYYDEIRNFDYEPSSRKISFDMPFEWSLTNINQTSVVHEEIRVPDTFGDLLVSGYTMYVNDVKLDADIVNIDDFFGDHRVVHFIIHQKALLGVLETLDSESSMRFVITPDSDDMHLSSVTDNGQFRILVSWDPENLKSNSMATILFDVTDIFLKNKPVATNYDFSITQGSRVIFEQTGISTDSKDEHNVAQFLIPDDVSGIVHLNFDNLDNNNLAKTTFPIVIDRVELQNEEISIPQWVRNNAEWWAAGQIDDVTFIQSIEYLIKNDILVIPATQQESSENQEIPAWVRNNAEWWAAGQIDDETFVQGLEYLIKRGIVNV